MRAILVLDGPRSAQANMALDEAALRHVSRAGDAIARVYTWMPPGLSLGRSQPASEIIIEKLRGRGIVPVRRPTGGRAILHLPGDLTYSVVAPATTPLHRASIEEAAFAVATAIARALVRLGIPARPAGLTRYEPAGPLCLAARGSGDIIVDGFKVSGAAVARTRGATLVHGVILVEPDRSLWEEIIPEEHRWSVEQYMRKVAGLRGLGYGVSLRGLASALERELEPVLGAPAERGSLPWSVVEEAQRLAVRKYSSESWMIWGEA